MRLNCASGPDLESVVGIEMLLQSTSICHLTLKGIGGANRRALSGCAHCLVYLRGRTVLLSS